MCLAIPGKVVDINGDTAIVDYGGIRKSASTLVMPDVKIGEIVMVHAGFIIARIQPEEAEKTIDAIRKLAETNI